MGSESLQKKVKRVNRPRVQIEYDVETNGAMEKVELPFVVGVMADLSGHAATPLPRLLDRKFVDISPSNFSDVMGKIAPRLAFRVPNKLANDGTQLGVELNFKSIDDFQPAKVAGQIGPLKELLDMREKLTQILAKMPGNQKLETMLEDVLKNTETARTLAKELGIEGTQPEGGK